MSGDVLIIGSGPSLTRADCDTLKKRVPTIAINNAVFFAPWADYLYAGDERWWKFYLEDISWYRGERVTHQPFGGYRTFGRRPGFARFGGNSGHQAVQFAAADLGADRIILLGFDHKYLNPYKKTQVTHFHGDHPKPLGNAHHVDHWPRLMERTARDLVRMGVSVVNITRDTALTCFDLMSLEELVEVL